MYIMYLYDMHDQALVKDPICKVFQGRPIRVYYASYMNIYLSWSVFLLLKSAVSSQSHGHDSVCTSDQANHEPISCPGTTLVTPPNRHRIDILLLVWYRSRWCGRVFFNHSSTTALQHVILIVNWRTHAKDDLSASSAGSRSNDRQ